MEHDFWKERWREGRIGFHEGKPNRYLDAHHRELGEGRSVLVPLCGKAEDLAYLAARGHRVTGVELVEDAVRAFFAEHELAPEIERAGAHAIYRAGAITVFAGDFFTADLAAQSIDALYDRAALIALPPAMRPDYIRRVRALVPAGAPGLLITVEYPPEQHAGPPFPVLETEVRGYFENPRLCGEGFDPRVAGGVDERCWAVTV